MKNDPIPGYTYICTQLERNLIAWEHWPDTREYSTWTVKL